MKRNENKPYNRRRGKEVGPIILTGCLIVIFVPLILGLLYWGWRSSQKKKDAQEAEVRAEARARDETAPVIQKLKEAARRAKERDKPYDIDKTVRVMYALDMAVADYESLPDYLDYMSRLDYRDVPPELLEARMDIIELLRKLHARDLQLKHQGAMWDAYRDVVGVLSSVGSVKIGATGLDVDVDREKAEKLLKERLEQKSRLARLDREVQALRNETYMTMLDNSELFYEYLEKWDRVCVHRDAAYLALMNRDWPKVISESEQARELAPHDRESPLLKARALIESVEPGEGPHPARPILENYVEENPERSAPAFLLLGALEYRLGNDLEAREALQQAAAYYPRQSEYLSDMLDPYKMRSFLRKSREGRGVIELYKSMMLGAGFFSPDLQLARTHFDAGENEKARAKILDHFFRRRSQRSLDYIISDLIYCYDYLGVDFMNMLPDQFYLDLNWKPRLIGDAVSLEVQNRGETTLSNVSLVLCIQFTEMLRNDYETVMAPRSLPKLPAGESADFGDLKINFSIYGKEKSVDDIVACRAILISNEAVAWIDSAEFKNEQVQRERELARRDAESGLSLEGADWEKFSEILTPEKLDLMLKESDAELKAAWGFGEVIVTLPGELALLKPIFRLKDEEGESIPPAENVIKDGAIRLRFKEFGLVDSEKDEESGEKKIKPMELRIHTRYGDKVIPLSPKNSEKE